VTIYFPLAPSTDRHTAPYNLHFSARLLTAPYNALGFVIAFQYIIAGLVKNVCALQPTFVLMMLQKLCFPTSPLVSFRCALSIRAFFSSQRIARLPAGLPLSTRSFCESILFVRLEALRGFERRVVRIVGKVGLTPDQTPKSLLVMAMVYCFI